MDHLRWYKIVITRSMGFRLTKRSYFFIKICSLNRYHTETWQFNLIFRLFRFRLRFWHRNSTMAMYSRKKKSLIVFERFIIKWFLMIINSMILMRINRFIWPLISWFLFSIIGIISIWVYLTVNETKKLFLFVCLIFAQWIVLVQYQWKPH